MDFGAEAAAEYDSWYQTPLGRYADALEKELFSRLICPEPGQRLLEVGCGTGHYLEFFKGLGLEAVGLDSSIDMLNVADGKLGREVKIYQGNAEDLPFGDNSFDLVAFVTTLEFVGNPARALKEAARVGSEKIYLGVLNGASILGAGYRIKARLRSSVYRQAKFYTIWELKALIRKALGEMVWDWGSVLFLPLNWHGYLNKLDRICSFRRNPFGAFLGVQIEVNKHKEGP